MKGESNFLEAALLRTMTLLATLRAAADVKLTMKERKAGLDPSEQESDAIASAYLEEAGDEIRTSLLQLRTSIVIAQQESDDPVTVSVRRFNDLNQIHRLSHLLHRIHQRLLSLYPRISEELAEDARIVALQSDALLEVEEADYFDHIETFIKRALQFITRLEFSDR